MKLKDRIQKYLDEGTQGFVKWIVKPKKKMTHLTGENDHNLLVKYWTAAGISLPYKQAEDFLTRGKPFLVPVVQSEKLRKLINKDRFSILDVTSQKEQIKSLEKLNSPLNRKQVKEAKEEKDNEKDKVVITITTNNVAANSLMPLLKKLKTFGEDINISVNSDDKDDAEDFVYAGKEGRIKSIKQKGMTEPMEQEKDEMELEEPEEELPMETPEEEM